MANDRLKGWALIDTNGDRWPLDAEQYDRPTEIITLEAPTMAGKSVIIGAPSSAAESFEAATHAGQ